MQIFNNHNKMCIRDRGMNVGPLRSPMCEMGEDNARKLAEVMKAYGLKLA